MQKTILVGLAGLAGTLLRYWLSGVVARRFGETGVAEFHGRPMSLQPLQADPSGPCPRPWRAISPIDQHFPGERITLWTVPGRPDSLPLTTAGATSPRMTDAQYTTLPQAMAQRSSGQRRQRHPESHVGMLGSPSRDLGRWAGEKRASSSVWVMRG